MTKLSNTVEYFPHYANASNKMTLRYLEGKYQYKGYTLWFKLLECLASTEGHYLDLNQTLHKGYLLECLRLAYTEPTAYIPLSYQELTDFLQDLATINAIDKDLWTNHSIVWSDNFVAHLSVVYANRHRSLPLKPTFGNNGSTPPTENLPATYGETTDISRSRVEEVERSRVEEVEDTTVNKIDKAKAIFLSFKENERYSLLDFGNEFKKFCEYWFEGKRKLKNTTLACHNWLDHALLYKQKNEPISNDPNKFTKGKYGKAVKT